MRNVETPPSAPNSQAHVSPDNHSIDVSPGNHSSDVSPDNHNQTMGMVMQDVNKRTCSAIESSYTVS